MAEEPPAGIWDPSPTSERDVAEPGLIYVGDPMCSWCWGFAPVLDRVHRRFDLPLRIVVGGLRAGARARPVDDRLRGFLAEHWDQVAEISGQSFTTGILDAHDWIYDTGPACRAVVAMRELLAETAAGAASGAGSPRHLLAWFADLQRAFYADGRDVTDEAVLAELAGAFATADPDGLPGGARPPVEPRAFARRLADPGLAERTREDFRRARSWGVHGFPTLLVTAGGSPAPVTSGYLPFEELEPTLRRWLDTRLGPQRAAELVRR